MSGQSGRARLMARHDQWICDPSSGAHRSRLVAFRAGFLPAFVLRCFAIHRNYTKFPTFSDYRLMCSGAAELRSCIVFCIFSAAGFNNVARRRRRYLLFFLFALSILTACISLLLASSYSFTFQFSGDPYPNLLFFFL